MAGFFVSAKSGLRDDSIVAVHPHLSGFDSLGKHECGVQVVGDDTRRKSIVGVVGANQHLFESFKLKDRLDRTEDLNINETN